MAYTESKKISIMCILKVDMKKQDVTPNLLLDMVKKSNQN